MKSSQSNITLEVQVHPSDIRRKVRYYFLTWGHIATWILGFVVLLVFLGAAALLSPEVMRNVQARQDYQAEIHRRSLYGDRLQGLLERMKSLELETTDLRNRMNKVYLAYGMSTGESLGKGGFPLTVKESPESVYRDQIHFGYKLQTNISEEMAVLGAFLDEVTSFEGANSDQALSTPSISPLRRQDFVLTSPYGTRRSPFTKEIDFHAGVDLAARTGTTTIAPADGIVVFAGRYPLRQSVSWWRYGNLVAMRHGDRFVTLFGHLDEVKVKRGQKVAQGEEIGSVGNTGWSTSPHLHYEVRRLSEDGNFHPVDPRIYILDQKWRDEEKFLIRARQAPDTSLFEPLPRSIARR